MNIEDLNNRIRAAVREDSDKTGAIVFAGLTEDQLKGRLPLNIFVNYFLPRFAGIIPAHQAGNYIPEWISIAGTPMNEVDIFDPSTGEIVVTVPGIVNSANLFAHHADGDINDILTRHNMVKNNDPRGAAGMLMEGLDSRLEVLINNVDQDSHLNRWLAIFAKFGLVPAFQQQNGTAEQPNSPVDEGLDY